MKPDVVTLAGNEYPFFFGMASLDTLLERHDWTLENWRANSTSIKVQTEIFLLGLQQGHDIVQDPEGTKSPNEIEACPIKDEKHLLKLMDRSEASFSKMVELVAKNMTRVMGVDVTDEGEEAEATTDELKPGFEDVEERAAAQPEEGEDDRVEQLAAESEQDYQESQEEEEPESGKK
jgi:hypothetical protein